MRYLNAGPLKSLRSGSAERSRFRQYLFNKHHSYQTTFAYCADPHYSSLELSGNKIWVLGSQPQNFESAVKLLQRLDKLDPTLICLSTFYPESYKNYQYFNDKRMYSPVEFPYKDQDLAAKLKFNKFFDKDYGSNLYFFTEEAGVCYFADPQRKLCIADDFLSAAHWAYLNRECGLVTPAAHPFMVHEDLCHQLSLDRLRTIFHNSVDEYNKRSKALGWEPSLKPIDLYTQLHRLIKSDYYEDLYKKRIQHTASVIRKVSGSFRRIVVVHDHVHCNQIEDEIKNGKAEHGSFYQSKELDGDINEMMEKIVILSHLDDKIVRNWIEAGVNPFEYMFQNQFKNPIHEIQEGFDYFNEYYKDYLSKSLYKEIERIPFLSDRGRNTVKVLESAKKIEQHSGGFIVGYYQNAIRNKIINEMLLKQILKNINKKLEMGLNQDKEIMALELIGKSEHAAMHLDILKKLITEANMQLRLTKLPNEFKKFEDMLYTKVSLESFYSHMKTAEVPKFRDNNLGVKFQPGKEPGSQFALIGSGDIPDELKGKSIEEIEKVATEKLYETPMGMDGMPLKEDFKTIRHKLKQVTDYFEEN